MKLHKITVTGADALTQIPDIIRFTSIFPRIEFGILVSSPWSQKVYGRYPSFEWIERLARYIDEGNRDNFSLHLCGEYVTDFFTSRNFMCSMELFAGVFSRMQVNTHNCLADYDLEVVTKNIGYLLSRGVTPILQYDDNNAKTIDLILDNVPPMSAQCLYDMSHGAGTLPVNGWKESVDRALTGYAGGLSPGNVAEQLQAIDGVVSSIEPIWIDAETHLRTGDVFDLSKVEAFYRAAANSPVVINKDELL